MRLNFINLVCENEVDNVLLYMKNNGVRGELQIGWKNDRYLENIDITFLLFIYFYVYIYYFEQITTVFY